MTQLTLIPTSERGTATKPSKWQPLIESFAGSKRSDKYKGIYDGGSYDVRFSPFAGSGGEYRHLYHIKHAIVADADPSVRAIWKCWGNKTSEKFVQRRLASIYGDFKEGPARAYIRLKEQFEAFSLDSEEKDIALAAVSLTLRRLTHGSIIRCARTTGALNVALSQDKLSNYWNWSYEFPEPMDSLYVGEHWVQAIAHLRASNFERAIAVIDPPYMGDMTAAYPGHDPKSINTLELCTNCLRGALSAGKIARAVVFNYYNPQLDEAIQTIAKAFDIPCWGWNLGPFQPITQGKGKHEKNHEFVWEIGGRRMFRDRPMWEQESLLEGVGVWHS